MLTKLFKKRTIEDIVVDYANEDKETVNRISWVMNNQLFINSLLEQTFNDESLDKLRSSIPKLEHAVETFSYLSKHSNEIKSVVYDKQAIVNYSKEFLSEFEKTYKDYLNIELSKFNSLYTKLSSENSNKLNLDELICLSKRIILLVNSSLSKYSDFNYTNCFGNRLLCSLISNFSNYEESKSRVETAVELIEDNFYQSFKDYLNHKYDDKKFDSLLSAMREKIINLKQTSKRLLDKKLFEHVDNLCKEFNLVGENNSFRNTMLSLNDNLNKLFDDETVEVNEVSSFRISSYNREEGVKKVSSIIKLVNEYETLSNQLILHPLADTYLIKKYFLNVDSNLNNMNSTLIRKGKNIVEGLITLSFNETGDLKEDLGAITSLDDFSSSLKPLIYDYVKLLDSQNKEGVYNNIISDYSRKAESIRNIKKKLEEVMEHEKYISSAVTLFRNKFLLLSRTKEINNYILDTSSFINKEKVLKGKFSKYLGVKIDFVVEEISRYKKLAENKLNYYKEIKCDKYRRVGERGVNKEEIRTGRNNSLQNRILMSIHNILSSSDSSSVEEDINVAEAFYRRLNASSVSKSDKEQFNSFLEHLSKEFPPYADKFGSLILI